MDRVGRRWLSAGSVVGLALVVASCGLLFFIFAVLEFGLGNRSSERVRIKDGVEYYHFTNSDGSQEYTAVGDDFQYITEYYDKNGKLEYVEDYWGADPIPIFDPATRQFTYTYPKVPKPREAFGEPPPDPGLATLLTIDKATDKAAGRKPRGRSDASRGNPDEPEEEKKKRPAVVVPAEGAPG